MKRTASFLAATLLAVMSQSSMAALATQQDRVSYVMGLETGKALRAQHVVVNASNFSQGLTDGLSNKRAQLTAAEIKKTMLTFQNTMHAKMQHKLNQLAAVNGKKGQHFLAANKLKSGVKVTKSGLQYKILELGHGNRPTASDTVTVDYEGQLIDGTVFDSSYKRKQPASFPVNKVIAGWTEALQLMPVGSTWQLYIPANLAYGKMGAPGLIGPNEVLIFKVHLRSIDKK